MWPHFKVQVNLLAAGPEEPGQVAPEHTVRGDLSFCRRASVNPHRSLIFPSFSVASAKLEILTISEQLMKTSDRIVL